MGLSLFRPGKSTGLVGWTTIAVRLVPESLEQLSLLAVLGRRRTAPAPAWEQTLPGLPGLNAPVSADSSFTGGFTRCKKMQRIPVVTK